MPDWVRDEAARIGKLALLLSVPAVAIIGVFFQETWRPGRGGSIAEFVGTVAIAVGEATIIAWLLTGAPKREKRRLRLARNECPECGYDRSGLGDETACPECGTRVTT